jgi:phosphoglycerate dehydrogenase-like enzyme
MDSPLRRMPHVLLAPHNANASPTAHERVHWNTLKNLLTQLRVPFELQSVDASSSVASC